MDRYEARLVAIAIIEHAHAQRYAEADQLLQTTEIDTLVTGLVHIGAALVQGLATATSETPDGVLAHLRATAHLGVT